MHAPEQPESSSATRPDPVKEPTITVERAGAILGIGRASAYQAATAGEIPTIRIGKRLIVPTAKLLAMLGDLPGSTGSESVNNASTLTA